MPPWLSVSLESFPCHHLLQGELANGTRREFPEGDRGALCGVPVVQTIEYDAMQGH